ncbi:hypothetical protein LPTSP3_g18470 [Leptospira kobayashii]|uniref:Uncharacterized protein n=1 Tax=Leptospira kobayashii TaxID=1917830 RepID=A0ABM7UJB8_9LEPT|nr:hypothetical protein [Leptospira kobayashii]BDA78917.1 hypothetical protein LPTSP3_g18470 [Leptospira kobayashii]
MIHSLDSLILRTFLSTQGRWNEKLVDPKEFKSSVPVHGTHTSQLLKNNLKNPDWSGSNKQELASFLKIRNGFFNESKTEQWQHATEKSDPKSIEWKPLWNFLFPEIQWTKNRIHFQDKKKKRSFEGFFQKEGEADYYFCALFESLITGKIWILFYFSNSSPEEGILEMKANLPHTLTRLKKDIPKLKPAFSGIGEIRFFMEPNRDSAEFESEIRGMFA